MATKPVKRTKAPAKKTHKLQAKKPAAKPMEASTFQNRTAQLPPV